MEKDEEKKEERKFPVEKTKSFSPVDDAPAAQVA